MLHHSAWTEQITLICPCALAAPESATRPRPRMKCRMSYPVMEMSQKLNGRVAAPSIVEVPVRALIFDMDGTMVDSMPAHASSWEAFTRRHGIDLPITEVLRRTTG